MNKKYAVILWSDEPTNYSAVKVAKINYDKNAITSEHMLVDQFFDIKLDKNSEEICVGKVIQVGSRAKMSTVAADLAGAAAELSFNESDSIDRLRKRNFEVKPQVLKKSKPFALDEGMQQVTDTEINEFPLQNSNSSESAEENVHLVAVVENDGAGQCCDYLKNELEVVKAQLVEKEALVEDLRSKLGEKNRKMSKLQMKLSAMENNESQNTVDIGAGFSVSTELVQDLKLNYKHNPGMFLRKLMEKSNMFTLEEIAESSLTGQKHRGGVQRPRLNSSKFNACKDFTIQKCKVKEDSIQMMQFKKSMINICTDARKRIKKQSI